MNTNPSKKDVVDVIVNGSVIVKTIWWKICDASLSTL